MMPVRRFHRTWLAPSRARVTGLRLRTQEWQRLKKLLERALVKLPSVVQSPAKAETATNILEAIRILSARG